MNANETGIDYWSRHLATIQLPVLSAPEALAALLDPAISVQGMARLLRADLSLALDALLMAARLPQVGGEPQSMAHAVAVFGVERLQNLVRARMERVFDPERPGHRGFARALIVNRLAAMLVERWDGTRQPGGAESLYWMTLACGSVRFRLPLLAPAVAEEIERRVQAGEDRSRVEAQVLGCRSDALAWRLVREMGLTLDPALIDSLHVTGLRLARAARQANDPFSTALSSDPGLAWLRQRQALCILGHLVAWSVHDGAGRVRHNASGAARDWRPWQGWHAPRTLELMKVVAVHLRWPLDKVISSAHNVAVRASRLPDLLEDFAAPAESLIWPAPQLPPPPQLPLPTLAAEAMPGWAVDEGKLQQFTEHSRSGRVASVRELLTAALQTVRDALGLPRALVLVGTAQDARLKCRLAQGFDDRQALAVVAVDPQGDDLIARLYRHAGSLAVTPQRLKLVRGQLPPALQTLAPATGMLLATLKSSAGAWGVLWVDAGDQQAAPDQACYEAFCRIVAALNHALAHQPRKAG